MFNITVTFEKISSITITEKKTYITYYNYYYILLLPDAQFKFLRI